MVEQLEATADEMPPAVAAEYEELKTLKRALTVADSTSGRPNPGDLAAWKKALDAVDERRARAGGVFGDEGEGGLKAPPGQAVCSQLLHDCYTLLHGLEQR